MVKSLGISQKYRLGVFVQAAAPQTARGGRKVPRSPPRAASGLQGPHEAYCRGGRGDLGDLVPQTSRGSPGGHLPAPPHGPPRFLAGTCAGGSSGVGSRRAPPRRSPPPSPAALLRAPAPSLVPSPRAAEGRQEPSEPPSLKGGRPRPGLQLPSSPRSGWRAAPQRAGAS